MPSFLALEDEANTSSSSSSSTPSSSFESRSESIKLGGAERGGEAGSEEELVRWNGTKLCQGNTGISPPEDDIDDGDEPKKLSAIISRKM